MSINQLTTEPAAIYAGDTISWLIPLAGYPASSGWTLKYNAVGAAGQFNLVSSASGIDHAVSIAKATTANYKPGLYTLTKYVENVAGERVTLSEIPLIVKPDLAGKTAALDTRSHAKKVLDAIEAVLENRATTDQQELTLNGKTLKRTPVADLLSFRSKYLQEYKNELAANRLASGLGSGNKILVRFL